MADKETSGELSLGALLAAVGEEAPAGNADGRAPQGGAAASPLDTLRGIGWHDEAPIRFDAAGLAPDDRAEKQADEPFDLAAALGYNAGEAGRGTGAGVEPEAEPEASEAFEAGFAALFGFSIAVGGEPLAASAAEADFAAEAEPEGETGPAAEAAPKLRGGGDAEAGSKLEADAASKPEAQAAEPAKPVRKGRFADVPVHRPGAAASSERKPATQEVREQPASPREPEGPAVPGEPEAPIEPEAPAASGESEAPTASREPEAPEAPASSGEPEASPSHGEPGAPDATRKLPRIAEADAPEKLPAPTGSQPAAEHLAAEAPAAAQQQAASAQSSAPGKTAPVKRRPPAKKHAAASAKSTPAKSSIAAEARVTAASLPSAKPALPDNPAAPEPATAGNLVVPALPSAPALPPASAPAVLPAADAAASASDALPDAVPHRAQFLRNAATVLVVLAAAVLVCAIGLFVAGFGAPSSDGADAKTSAAAEGAAPTSPSSAMYRYQVSGPDGAACPATETASFDENGLLRKSVIAVETANADVAQRYLDDTKEQFGAAFLGGGVNGGTVTVTLAADEPAPSRDAYTELLMRNTADCEVVE